MRDAFVMAGVLPRGHANDRLQFVTEAEASVHFALEHSDGDRWLTVGTNFSVLDAGGSTVDTTMYRCTALTPKLKLEEVTSSECVQAGRLVNCCRSSASTDNYTVSSLTVMRSVCCV